MATTSEDAFDERRRRRLEREKQYELEQQQWEIERKRRQEERQKRRETRKNSQQDLTTSSSSEPSKEIQSSSRDSSEKTKEIGNREETTNETGKIKSTNEEDLISTKVQETSTRNRYRGQTWAASRSREQLPSVLAIWKENEKPPVQVENQPPRNESPALERIRKREEERIKREQERRKKLEEELRESQLELERKEREIELRSQEIKKREEELKLKLEEEDRKRSEEREKKRKEKEEQKRKILEDKLKLEEEKKKKQEEDKLSKSEKKKKREIVLDERTSPMHFSPKETKQQDNKDSQSSQLLKDIFKELNSNHVNHVTSSGETHISHSSKDTPISHRGDTQRSDSPDIDIPENKRILDSDIVPSPRVSKTTEENISSPSRYGSLRRHNELVKKIREEQDEWENERKAREELRIKRKEERRTKLVSGDSLSSSSSSLISKRSSRSTTPSTDPVKFTEPIQIPSFDSVNKYSDLDDLLSDLVNVSGPPKISRERSSSAIDLMSNIEREFITSIISTSQEKPKDSQETEIKSISQTSPNISTNSQTSPNISANSSNSFTSQLLATITHSSHSHSDHKTSHHQSSLEKPFVMERSQSNIDIDMIALKDSSSNNNLNENKTVVEERALSKSAVYVHEMSPRESDELQFAQIIIDRLYLGSCGAAGSKDKLKKAGITHILTVAHDFAPLFPKDFIYKVVKIEDNPREDLIQHFPACLEFISQAISNGKILVHCIAGKSRSVSTVAAYLMKNLNFTLENALNHIQLHRKVVNRAEINFIPQLEMFEQLKCELSVREHLRIEYWKYKHFTLWDKLQALYQHWKEKGTIDESKLVPNDFEEKEDVYKCQKCEKVVFAQRSWNECEFVFIAPAKWMKDSIKSKNGDINCPHCKKRLGLYSWVPTTHSKCSCYVVIQPVFRVMCNKINFVQNSNNK